MLVESFKHNGHVVKIVQDSDAESPRQWDNLGTMVCSHSRYNLGDAQGTADDVPEDAVCLPLYLYDHSGITMRCSPFSCPWDSGQVGVIYCERSKIMKEFGCKRIGKKIKDRVIDCLVAEVETYDQYLRGEVYGYVIEDDEGNHLDSCYGFFGMDNVMSEAKSMAESIKVDSYAI